MMKASQQPANHFFTTHKPLLVSQGYAWRIRKDEAAADGHTPSPCPLALFVSQAGEAKHHYLLSGFFSQGVQTGKEIKRE